MIPPRPDFPALREPHKGMSFGCLAKRDHYASPVALVEVDRMAERTGCEMYCIGCELFGAEQAFNNARWDVVVAATREVYSGPVCYDVQPPTLLELAEPPAWLRGLDAVCISYYTAAAAAPGWTAAQMVEKFRPTAAILRRASEKLGGLPIIFGETGCRSLAGSAMDPSNYRPDGAYAPDEQANFLEAMCTLFGTSHGGSVSTGGSGTSSRTVRIITPIPPATPASPSRANRRPTC